MRTLLGSFLVYLVIKLFLLSVASVVSFLLRWLFPTVDIGMGLLIGLLATGMTLHFLGRLTSWLRWYSLVDDRIEPDFSPPPVMIVEPPTRRRGRRPRS